MADMNKLARGEFNPHRLGVAAVDGAILVSTKGLNTRAFDGVVFDIKLASGSLTSFTAELLYWSPASGRFVKAAPAVSVTSTTPGQWTAKDTGDRIVFLSITDLQGASPKLDIYAAALARATDVD